MSKLNYNPDVLSCLANLSNDEVFTPPQLANQMLDMLPQELFQSPNTKFFDPCTKSGVFLREIAKRLIDGLADKIPDLQKRIDHIMQHQLYGIAITRLTALMSRRSLYCSKDASCKYSLSHFDNADGNIYFDEILHTWQNGKCIYCGASQEVYDRGEDLETHAYEFIHTDNPNELYNNMTFDVIIGNPPYQLNDGGGTGSSAIPIYNKFVEQAKRLKPKYLTMIIPSRWFSGGKGLDEFRDNMLSDNRLRCLVDYFDSTECFPGVDLSGGVCYFLWEGEYNGDCKIINKLHGEETVMNRPLLETGNATFIRFNSAVSIIRKIRAIDNSSIIEIISARKPFGIDPKARIMKDKSQDSVRVYAYPDNGYINRYHITQNENWIDQYKVMIAKAYGERGDFPYLMLGKPFVAEKGSCCTETYLVIGPFGNRIICENVISYIKTKLFRFLVLQKKNTQNAAKGVYEFVPLQDFSKPWTDEELYKKYGLAEEEIAFIESMIRPME